MRRDGASGLAVRYSTGMRETWVRLPAGSDFLLVHWWINLYRWKIKQFVINVYILISRENPEGLSSFDNKALTADDHDMDDVDGAVHCESVYPWPQGESLTTEHNDQTESDDELVETPKDKSKLGNIFKMVSNCYYSS